MRAIAVLLVVVFHFDLFSGGKTGFMGVDIFFVISGFLITSIIKTQLDENRFSIKSFYLNRIRRLAPALFIVLLLVIVAGSFWFFPLDFVELAKQALFSQTYVANIYFWRNVHYFGLGENRFLLHMWSLAVEEQFYLLYPFVLLLVHRYLQKYIWGALALGLALSFALNVFFVGNRPGAAFYLLPMRAWELLAGGLILFLNTKSARSRTVDELLGVLGLGLILAAVIFFSIEIRFPGFFALLPTFGAVCLILSGSGSATLTSRLLSLRPVVYVGKISYPLYLVHWPVNVFAPMLLIGSYSLPWRFAMFSFSIVLSAMIYHLVENPFRRRHVFAGDGRLAQGYLAGLAATLLIFLVVYGTGGVPTRFPDEVVRIASFVNDKTPALPGCEFTGKALLSKKDFCQIGVPDREPEWLVYGDSHAWAAYSVFDKWLKLKGQAGLFVFRNSCPPVKGVHLFRDKGTCFAFNQAISGFLGANSGIRNVFLVATWREAEWGHLSTSPDILLPRDDSIKLFQEQFSETIENLTGLGRQVYVWEPVPGARRNVPVALARAALTNHPADIEIGRDEYMSSTGFFFAALRKNQHLIAMSFSPSEVLCKSGRCLVTVNGDPAYFDDSHITKSSADFWVRMMQLAESKSNTRLFSHYGASEKDDRLEPRPLVGPGPAVSSEDNNAR